LFYGAIEIIDILLLLLLLLLSSNEQLKSEVFSLSLKRNINVER